MRRTLLILGALAALHLYGCAGDSAFPLATGKGTVRAINAITTSPAITFLIEERQIGTAGYKGATGSQAYDDLEYTFNFEVNIPITGRRRIASQFLDVVADKDYTFVISGTLANATVTLWEGDTRQWEETDTVFESRFGHAAAALGPVDVYFAPAGTAPVLGEQIGTLSFGEILPAADYAEGIYVVTYTARGDPLNVLFTSDPVARGARDSSIVTLFDADANDLAPVSVWSFNAAGAAARLTDASFPPTLRFFNASTALGTADIYNDENLLTALVIDHAFGDITGDIEVSAGTNSLTYTAPGNTGSILFENAVTVPAGTRGNYYVVGETGALSAITHLPDRRSVETVSKFSFMHAATNHPSVDVYIVEADADIAEINPSVFSVPVGLAPLQTELVQGSFDLYVTTAGEKTVIIGPVRLDTTLGGVIDIIMLDTVDPATADIVFIPVP